MRYGNTYKNIIIFLFITILILCMNNIWKQEKIQDNQTPDGIVSIKNKNEKKKLNENQVEEDDYYPEQTYVDAETIPDTMICPEEYSPYPEEIQITCYFTNTEKTLDVKGVFPLAAHGTLLESVQQWLKVKGLNTRELRCIDDSLHITGEEISFMAECADLNGEVFKGVYDLQTHCWSFTN